ncbi:MAG: MFS transporter, partial [Euryarchaeota archaeon]|nr:MFS transporter [Euryarchaeota archaeon]
MSGVGYIELLRRNSSFRRLFIANEISFIGDWFTVIALFILAGEATDNSPLAIAGVMASRSFALALVTPFTGMLADRYSRKGLMLGANIA